MPAVALADLRFQAMELEPGRTIGPYRLIRKLGEGTTSRVFEVEHVAIRRRAAMKIAHTDSTLPGIGKRLFAEAQAVNLINHPNIVAITEIIEPTEDHHAFALVMELRKASCWPTWGPPAARSRRTASFRSSPRGSAALPPATPPASGPPAPNPTTSAWVHPTA